MALHDTDLERKKSKKKIPNTISSFYSLLVNKTERHYKAKSQEEERSKTRKVKTKWKKKQKEVEV